MVPLQIRVFISMFRLATFRCVSTSQHHHSIVFRCNITIMDVRSSKDGTRSQHVKEQRNRANRKYRKFEGKLARQASNAKRRKLCLGCWRATSSLNNTAIAKTEVIKLLLSKLGLWWHIFPFRCSAVQQTPSSCHETRCVAHFIWIGLPWETDQDNLTLCRDISGSGSGSNSVEQNP
jgi:hypothetical protein